MVALTYYLQDYMRPITRMLPNDDYVLWIAMGKRQGEFYHSINSGSSAYALNKELRRIFRTPDERFIHGLLSYI